jgi:Spy/CpxP family protein refolding chaperone
MDRKRLLSWSAAAAGLILAATCGVASAHGMHGGHGGGDQMWLLARAAGLSHEQIGSAFHNDPNLKADFSNLHSAREALTSCIAKGGSCTSEISAYASAKQALTTEKMGVWQKLFQSPNANTKQSTAVLGQLRNLREQRHKIFEQVFASARSGASAPAGDSPQVQQ